MGVPKTSFSVYLLRDGTFEAARQALFSEATPLTDGLEGSFMPIFGQQQVPPWFRSISRYLPGDYKTPLRSQSAAGIMMIHRGARTFIICFGHGWQRLESLWLEPNFGRRVALNAIPPNQILELSSEQVLAKWHLARERAPDAASVREFGVEFDRDLVYAIEGVTSEEILGRVLRGGPSLRMTIPIESLGAALDRSAVLFASDAYKKRWPDIDNLVVVDDATLQTVLDDRLNADLAGGHGAGRIVLFSPSQRHGDGMMPESYVFGRRTKNSAPAPFLLFGAWERYLTQQRLPMTVASAKKSPIHLLDADGELLDMHSVYHCMGYEAAHDGRQYILSSGIWYEAASNFVRTIDQEISALKSPCVRLPAWDQICREGDYNRVCCKSDGSLLHFDAKLVPFGARGSKFEFCDFMHLDKKALFFAKIPTRSSDMSHLTEQVRRTVELFFGADNAFRSKLKATFAKHYPRTRRTWLDDRPRPHEWELCLVSLGRRASDLPLFAKSGVVRLVRSLNTYNLSFAAV